jgi:SET domain-containing protein
MNASYAVPDVQQPIRTAVGLYVASSPVDGRGVFTSRPLAPGDVVETCPVIIIPAEQCEAFEGTNLAGYWFEWEGGAGAIALGYGSLYNHSWRPNARYEHDYDTGTVIYVAIRHIGTAEEVTINYSGEPDGRAELWF